MTAKQENGWARMARTPGGRAKLKAYTAKYEQLNYSARKAAVRRYKKAHPDAVFVAQQLFRKRYPGIWNEYARQDRQKVLDYYGNKCARCGFSDPRALQIDHVNGNGHKEGRVKYSHVLATPERYQVLCANCNWIKRHERGEN